ncbi:MAG TPA: aminotransferase class IV [Gaiellaceae bacterium]|nr:aminotransferase class IV [Gaiellaceae bacterium]
MTLLAVSVSGRGAVDPDEPVVHADDEGFLRGRGAFETTRVYGGRPFRLDEHVARLQASAARLGLSAPDATEIEGLVAEALEQAGSPDAFLRIYATPGREGSGVPLVLALVGELPADLEQTRARGIRLAAVPLGLDLGGVWPLGGVKSMSYAVNMMALDDARRRGADDALLLAQADVVLECTTSNVWWRRGSTLVTPALDLGILAGVTRAAILEILPQLGYEAVEGAFPVAELAAADEAFTTSSVREVMPAVALDGAPIADGRPGPAARALQAALRRAATAGERAGV